MSLSLLGWLVVAVIFAQGMFLAVTPDRAIRYTLWKTRLIGARVADPGRGTMAFYRIQGIAAVAVSLFIAFQLLSE